MKLLVIRPEPGAAATAARIRAAGHEVVVMPLFAIEPVAWEPPAPGSHDAILLTSSNAVRQSGLALAQLEHLPVYCVGSATAHAAREAGLRVARVGETGASAILSAAAAAGHRRLLWLAGEDRGDLQVPIGLSIDTCTVYRSRALAAPSDFADIIGVADKVLLHSPRAATLFRSLCDSGDIDPGQITIAALSPAIAEAARTGWREIIVAPVPSDAALLSQLQSSFTVAPRDP